MLVLADRVGLLAQDDLEFTIIGFFPFRNDELDERVAPQIFEVANIFPDGQLVVFGQAYVRELKLW